MFPVVCNILEWNFLIDFKNLPTPVAARYATHPKNSCNRRDRLLVPYCKSAIMSPYFRYNPLFLLKYRVIISDLCALAACTVQASLIETFPATPYSNLLPYPFAFSDPPGRISLYECGVLLSRALLIRIFSI